jgi:hypothetical protein
MPGAHFLFKKDINPDT